MVRDRSLWGGGLQNRKGGGVQVKFYPYENVWRGSHSEGGHKKLQGSFSHAEGGGGGGGEKLYPVLREGHNCF